MYRTDDIGAVVIESQEPVFCDPYRRNRVTDSFLIDPLTNATVGGRNDHGPRPIGGEAALTG